MAMNRTVCQYAILRFQPYVETGEFANVGVVLLDVARRYLGFRLQTPRRHARITKFFHQLEPAFFKAALRNMEEELHRIQLTFEPQGFTTQVAAGANDFTGNAFMELVRPRETILRFGELRTTLTENPEETLEKLYGFYVEHNFVNKEYRETVMERGVRKLLVQTNLAEYFVRKEIGDIEFHVAFPFVALRNELPTTIIKPLNLGQDDPTRIRERGNDWQFRIKELKKRNYLPPHVLFAVEGPEQTGKHKLAYDDAFEMLAQTGVHVVPYGNQQEIVKFARTAV
jgi:hypothetical protein